MTKTQATKLLHQSKLLVALCEAMKKSAPEGVQTQLDVVLDVVKELPDNFPDFFEGPELEPFDDLTVFDAGTCRVLPDYGYKTVTPFLVTFPNNWGKEQWICINTSYAYFDLSELDAELGSPRGPVAVLNCLFDAVAENGKAVVEDFEYKLLENN